MVSLLATNALMILIFVCENNYNLVRIDKTNWLATVTIDIVVNLRKTTMFFPQVNTVAAAIQILLKQFVECNEHYFAVIITHLLLLLLQKIPVELTRY